MSDDIERTDFDIKMSVSYLQDELSILTGDKANAQ
jgi:hypothetical protein